MQPRLAIILLVTFSFCITTVFSQTERIDSVMKALLQREQFKGSVLVAVEEKTIYRNAFGQTSTGSKQRFTPETVFNIASLAKAFTAMTIMMLAEENKLRYSDPVYKYLPELGKFSQNITIRHLLTHTSGIPDVGDLGIDNDGLTNAIAIGSLQKQQKNFRQPGQKYQYSNTGYLLLASITEKVSGKKFPDFLKERILQPLNLTSTSISGPAFGMGGMYSTIDDLLKWERSFYTQKLVRPAALDSAFTPYVVKEGSSTYGFGWNIAARDGDRMIWHTGNTGNNRAFIGRLIKDKIAVIILTEGDSKRMEIADAIVNIIYARPYKLPKMSVANKLYTVITKEGIIKGIEMYQTLKRSETENYDFGEGELNALGYRLMGDKKSAEAIKIFELNTTVYSASSNAFDSLAEAWLNSGNKELAIKYYKKAVELDPYNLNSKNALQKISQ